MEGVCYDQLHMTSDYPTKYCTMPELFDFALRKPHVNYMFWTRITTPPAPDTYDWNDALSVARDYPVFKP